MVAEKIQKGEISLTGSGTISKNQVGKKKNPA
jgi:hypothetical protein